MDRCYECGKPPHPPTALHLYVPLSVALDRIEAAA